MTFGKIIGGGMPVGAFGGRTDIMQMIAPTGPVYQAGTLSGNPVAMTAGLVTLKKLASGSIFSTLEDRNRRFVRSLTRQLEGLQVTVVGVGSIFWLVFQSDMPRAAHQISPDGIAHFNRMHERVLNSGVYLPPSGYEVCFISTAHTDALLEDAAKVLVDAIGTEAHSWA
jgi:glutamate-1-semialdehyde 2,1-aminomutase